MDRISRQKKEYETLLKQYSHEQKARHRGREAEQRRIEKQIAREMKLKQIREKKFEEELINQLNKSSVFAESRAHRSARSLVPVTSSSSSDSASIISALCCDNLTLHTSPLSLT